MDESLGDKNVEFTDNSNISHKPNLGWNPK
jgi:hypothetical protein